MIDNNEIKSTSCGNAEKQVFKEEANEKYNCLYDVAKVNNSSLGNYIVIGEDSYVNRCSLDDYVKLNRRNFIEDVIIGTCTYIGMNTIIKQAEIGKY